MSEQLPLPPELQHLIEKREREDDRREDQRRSGADQRADDLGPIGAIESADSVDDLPAEERRSGNDRRTTPTRRKKSRRKYDT